MKVGHHLPSEIRQGTEWYFIVEKRKRKMEKGKNKTHDGVHPKRGKWGVTLYSFSQLALERGKKETRDALTERQPPAPAHFEADYLKLTVLSTLQLTI